MCTIGPARFMGFLDRFGGANPGCDLTLVEGVPAGLSQMLLQGELDLVVMAQPDAFNERLDILPLYRERFCIAFPAGHRLEQQNRVAVTDVAGETYLRRINCEYRDYLAERLAEHGLAVRVGFQSEREDWIQMMVAAGFGVCFLPEYSPTIPGACAPNLSATPRWCGRFHWRRCPAGASRPRCGPSSAPCKLTIGPAPATAPRVSPGLRPRAYFAASRSGSGIAATGAVVSPLCWTPDTAACSNNTAIRPVHPVWCAAPTPRPVSPWKYSWNSR